MQVARLNLHTPEIVAGWLIADIWSDYWPHPPIRPWKPQTRPSKVWGPNLVQCAQQENWVIAAGWAGSNCRLATIVGTHSTHKEQPWSTWFGDQGTLCYRVPQDLSFTRSLLSIPGNIPDLPNTYKQTQGVRQNEETEKSLPNEGARQNYSKRAK